MTPPACHQPASSTPPELSVVIVSWNSREHLASCLHALPGAVAPLSWEVVVVDNASSDGTVEFLHETLAREIPELRILAHRENVGFGRGAQQGIVACRGRWVAVLNPDVVAETGSLAGLARFLREHRRVGVVGPAHRSPAGDPLAGGADPLPGVSSALADVPLVGRVYRRWRARRCAASTPVRCGYVRGACLVFRRRALEEIGGFPRETFLYGEEILIGHRMEQRGYEVWYLPHLSVVHDPGSSVRQRWRAAEVAVEQRRVRIQVLHSTLSRPGWLLWNAVAWLGLGLQGVGSRLGRRPSAESLEVLRHLHRRALVTRRPVQEETLR
jgi:GT2 family glycosyltransferase